MVSSTPVGIFLFFNVELSVLQVVVSSVKGILGTFSCLSLLLGDVRSSVSGVFGACKM